MPPKSEIGEAIFCRYLHGVQVLLHANQQQNRVAVCVALWEKVRYMCTAQDWYACFRQELYLNFNADQPCSG